MIKIGIECHKLESPSENQKAGIGRHLYKLLEEISEHPELQKEFRFYLYFKSFIPAIEFLKSPVFVKKIARFPFFFPFFRPSFNVFFHLALPLFCIKDKINAAFFPSFMMPALFTGKSVAVLTNDVYYEYSRGTLPLKFKLSYRLFSNWAAKRATYITTYSNFAKKEIVQFFKLNEDRVEVIPLGIDREFIENYAKDKNETEKKDKILYIGQAFPRRHLKETILAFEKISTAFPALTLTAIGIDKYNPPQIKKLARETNKKLKKEKIIYRESVSDDELLKSYREANLLIYVSSSEAMGLPPLEALAAKTPSVVADNELTREIFKDNAFFVKDPDNPDSIAQTIKEGLTNKEKYNQIVNSRHFILSKYTWPKHLDQMLKIFRRTAGL